MPFVSQLRAAEKLSGTVETACFTSQEPHKPVFFFFKHNYNPLKSTSFLLVGEGFVCLQFAWKRCFHCGKWL